MKLTFSFHLLKTLNVPFKLVKLTSYEITTVTYDLYHPIRSHIRTVALYTVLSKKLKHTVLSKKLELDSLSKYIQPEE